MAVFRVQQLASHARIVQRNIPFTFNMSIVRQPHHAFISSSSSRSLLARSSSHPPNTYSFIPNSISVSNNINIGSNNYHSLSLHHQPRIRFIVRELRSTPTSTHYCWSLRSTSLANTHHKRMVTSTTSNDKLTKKDSSLPATKRSSSSSASTSSSSSSSSSSSASEADKSLGSVGTNTKSPLLTRLWTSTKNAALHFWSGSKLLYANSKTAFRLLRKLTKGKKLTRREKRLMTRTAIDLARLVPFLFFMVIPFMEFLLPFALKLFPDMLPSTFRDKHRKEELLKQQLQMRLEMAAFLQETTEVMAQNVKNRAEGEKSKDAKNLIELLKRVREGKHVTNNDLIEVAAVFKDEITLERLTRPHLLNMSRYMGLPAYGSDSRLLRLLERRLDEIREDDQVIREEGISSLNLSELRTACAHRGIRVVGVGEASLRKGLADWLALSLDHSIPPSLLVLSRVFTFNRVDNTANITSIKTALQELDENVLDGVISESTGRSDNTQKLESVKRQLELVAEEESEALKIQLAEQRSEALKAQLAKSEEQKLAQEEIVDKAEEIRPQSNERLPDDSRPRSRISKSDVHEALKASSNLGHDEKRIDALKLKLKDITEDLACLADDSALSMERDQLEALKSKWTALDDVERRVAEAVVAKAVSEPAARKSAALLEQVSAQKQSTQTIKPSATVASKIQPEATAQPHVVSPIPSPTPTPIVSEPTPTRSSTLSQGDTVPSGESSKSAPAVNEIRTEATASKTVETDKRKEKVEQNQSVGKSDPEENVRTRLQHQVGKMLSSLQSDIENTDSKIGDKLRVLDRDYDGIMSYDEISNALKHSLKDCNTDAEARAIIEELDIKKDGKIDTEELRGLIRQYTHRTTTDTPSSKTTT